MRRRFPASDYVAIILASGVTLAIVILVIGIVWTAVKHGVTASSLTENEVQVLVASFSGIFGILGAYIGYRVSNGHKIQKRSDDEITAEFDRPEEAAGDQWPKPPQP